MKRIFVLLVSLLAFNLSNAQMGLLAGTGYAPNFTVTDINGNSHTLYDYLDNDKVVVLELMSVTCGHCISHAAGTEASYQANGPNGTDVAQFLGLEVNASTDSTSIANFAVTYGASFPIANNVSPTAINYQLYYTPGYYVIYPDRSYTTICAAYCVTAQSSSTIEGLLNSAISSWLPPVYGCTDSLAINYDPLATVDNDSCDYTSYTIKTVGMLFSPDTIVCDVGDTINFILGSNHNAVEVADSVWLSNGTVSNGGFNFGFGSTGMFIPDDCHTFYYVCQPHVNMGMKGVIIAHHPPVFGCTDSTASNYDSTATVDDGSCLYVTYAVDLFISEYAEGSGTNKYIEIFNGTGQDVDLSDYQLWKVTNGGTWPEYTFNLGGILSHNDVYIVYSSSSSVNPIISAAGDITWSQVTWTGDDAVGLAKSDAGLAPSFSLIDVIGEDGPDPGNGWDVAGITDATKDHTLIRKCEVNQGNTNWALSAGTNALDSEWEVLPQNDWSDIGQHTSPCESASVYGCMDSTALNYNSLATVDDGSCILPVYGCTDSIALNYDATANIDDGSCCLVSGCTNPLATNYDPLSCYDDGSCIPYIYGCMDPTAMNFDSIANTDDGSCVFLSDKVDLFFSEYGEGSSNNKYLEIYNSTSNPVDLSFYALTRVSNAPTTTGIYEYWIDFDSAAFVLPGDVYIVAHPSSDSIILNQADMTYSALSNGDDGFALVYGTKPLTPILPGSEYVILDFLGDFNGDPGSGWDVAGVSQATKDHVLIRKCDINIGNTNWTFSSGTDSLNSEWIVLANEDWSDIGQHTYCPPILGCTDPTATNYNPSANLDDGSCTYPTTCLESAPTGLNATDVIQNRATINWDNMNDTTTGCMVDQYRIKFRAVGSSSWTQKNMGQPVGSCLWACNKTDKLILNLTPSTQYEYQMKAWYCGGGSSAWSALHNFTTLDDCPNVGNLAVTSGSNTQATFTWDDSNGPYSFMRIKARVDTNNAAWFNVGGTGVTYGTFTKNKNNLTPGETYRGQARTWCDPNGGAYKSPTWTSLIFWTQPTNVRISDLNEKILIRITDILGREVNPDKVIDKTTLFYIYSDGTVEKKIEIE